MIERMMVTGAICVCLAFCSGCEWSSGGAVEHWDSDAADYVDFSGSYRAEDGGYLVTKFGTGVGASTNVVSGELLGTGDDDATVFGGNLAHPSIPGSLNIEVGAAGGYVFWDAPGGSGTAPLHVSPEDGSSGTINYDTGAWSLSFPAPLAAGAQIFASYKYTTFISQQGNVGEPIYSFTTSHTGNKLHILDSNGATYDGTIGSVRTAVDYGHTEREEIPATTIVQADFSAHGVSQAGLNVTIVGILQGRKQVDEDGTTDTSVYFDRVMHATYIEEGGEVSDIRAQCL